ncbi:MAG: polysaccharide biosynthesis protein, partial [Planctomycetota bacterium]
MATQTASEATGGGTGRRFRIPGPALLVVDAAAWIVGVVAAMAIRFDFSLAAWTVWRPAWLAATGALTIGGLGLAAGLYVRKYRRGSLDEGLALAIVISATCVVALGVNEFGAANRLVPVSVAVAAGPIAFCAAGSARFLERLVLVRQNRRRKAGASPVLIFGAGDGGMQVVSSMQADAKGRFAPIGFIDDDPTKRNLRLRGVPVVGDRDQLLRIAGKTGAEMLIVAAPSITSDSLRDLSARALAADIAIRIVPTVAELIDGSVGADDLRPLTEADLLGRHQIDTDIDAIADYVTGRRVLVTGAGGSIGSELCRQLNRFGPEQLVMLDRDESALHSVQMALEGRALLDSENLVVADIRDRARMREIFDRHRPHVVFHTAALKHLPLLEMHPAEAVKTNIFGTLNVLEAAAF